MVSSGKDNCLELLATKTFLKVKSLLLEVPGVSVILQLNNASAVAYINNMGGLADLAKELWIWTVQHIPGVSDTIADMESQTVNDKSD